MALLPKIDQGVRPCPRARYSAPARFFNSGTSRAYARSPSRCSSSGGPARAGIDCKMGIKGVVMKILLPVDGSDYSKAAVEFVASRSTLIGTEPQVDVVNVQLEVPVRAARVVG